MTSGIRIGIDVGGTFTHAVAVDGGSLEVLGKSKVPTSHHAPEGVARGIVESLQKLLVDNGIASDAVSFIAHSTTQATNALLEGDVARVGILGLSSAALAPLARAATRMDRITLASNIYMETSHGFVTIDGDRSRYLENARRAIEILRRGGCNAIAVSQAFGVDTPDIEESILEICRELGILATSGSEVSRLYGLRVRTRTAAINAAILPKMIESADLTEKSVRGAGIKAPIMIMRSDGGVMDIDAMRRKPILSILSGPAAGVAAAMMFLKISDGVFLEVGGTSTDISAIANGRALVRSAEIGGHKVYMRTLDVRTIGVAGGSLPRLSSSAISDIGPRSAHIAGLKYSSFIESVPDIPLLIERTRPLPKDPDDYLRITQGDVALSLTPTCAANYLGYVPDGDCARALAQSEIERSFSALALNLQKNGQEDGKQLAERMLTLAAEKCIPTVRSLISENKLDPELTQLVGGGGGAAAIVPYVGKTMGLTATLATHADVISAIGVAMALIRETIEKQVANPAQASETILAMRAEVFEAVHRMGADPATIEVHVEIDSKTSIVRATACGASQVAGSVAVIDDASRADVAARSLKLPVSELSELCRSRFYTVYGAIRQQAASLWGLKLPWLSAMARSLRVLDQQGVIRLQATRGDARGCLKENAEDTIAALIEEHASWGDAGKTIPDILLLPGARVIDLSGLLSEAQVLTLARSELANLPAGEEVLVVAKY